MRRHIVYCFCEHVGHPFNEINKVRGSGSRYLVDRLSERDEIWQIDGTLLYISAGIG